MEKIFDWNWIDKEEVSSTNDEALKLSQNVHDGKYVISAQMQNHGRGRRGRSWLGFPGNLFMSLLIQVPLSKLGGLVFVVALSLFDALKNLFPEIDIKLKWPNDVLLENNKISGILLEKGENDFLIIGIGVNVLKAPSLENVMYQTLSLADKGYVTDRLTLLKEYLRAFDKNFELWQTEGFSPIREKWLKNAKGLGQNIEARTVKETKCGIFRNIDENGALLLETQNGLEKIYAGDIFYI